MPREWCLSPRAVPGACPARSQPRAGKGGSQLSVSDRHLCLWQKKGQIAGVRPVWGASRCGVPAGTEAGEHGHHLGHVTGSPRGVGLRQRPGSHRQHCLFTTRLFSSSALARAWPVARAGFGLSPHEVYFRHPDDMFQGLCSGRFLHRLLISKQQRWLWTDFPEHLPTCVGHAKPGCGPFVPRLVPGEAGSSARVSSWGAAIGSDLVKSAGVFLESQAVSRDLGLRREVVKVESTRQASVWGDLHVNLHVQT